MRRFTFIALALLATSVFAADRVVLFEEYTQTG
jgi:hypothetical protein